jgi:hypothetical protein
MAKRHYILYCDESAKHGRYYSDFYGGALVAAADQQSIEAALVAKKEELNLYKEIKWTKITEAYQQKYIEFIQTYFQYVASGRIKIRIMFSQNYHKPKNLNEEHLENRYFLLYYQLIKHAFGFRYCNPNELDRVFVSILFDDLPDSKAKCDKFKSYVASISQTATYSGSGVFFPKEQIAEIDSHDHVIHQGLDIVLGAMQFRLNDLHKEKPEGKSRRGKRTIAKEKVYKEINRLIRQTYPNFNIGSSTGKPNGITDRWALPYSHWKFIPSEHEKDQSAVKPKK